MKDELYLLDKDSAKVLNYLQENISIDTNKREFSFKMLVKILGISEEKMDKILIELENKRFLNEYPADKNDIVPIYLTEKGRNFAQDAEE